MHVWLSRFVAAAVYVLCMFFIHAWATTGIYTSLFVGSVRMCIGVSDDLAAAPREPRTAQITTQVVKPNAKGRAVHVSDDAFKIDQSVSYTHLRAHDTLRYLVCRLLHEKKKLQFFCSCTWPLLQFPLSCSTPFLYLCCLSVPTNDA